MTRDEFNRLKIGDVVWTHFSNSYRKARVAQKEKRHAVVTAPATRGNENLERRARFESLDLTQQQKTNAEQAAYVKKRKAERVAINGRLTAPT